MAEIRKHDPATGNAIAQALRTAMGDQVRPNQPGSKPAPASTPPETDSKPEPRTSWINLTFDTPQA